MHRHQGDERGVGIERIEIRDQRDIGKEVIERTGVLARLVLLGNADEFLHVFEARFTVVGFIGLQLAQVARFFHDRDEQIGDRERLRLLAQIGDQFGEAFELALLLRHRALEQVRIEHRLADRHIRRVCRFE